MGLVKWQPKQRRKQRSNYHLTETPAARVVGNHIERYTGIDILGKLMNGQLKVEDVANLADIRKFMSEQREMLEYAAKHLEEIFSDVSQIEFHLKDIITKGLKSKEQINKYLKDILIAGRKHENSVHLLSSQLQNEMGYHEAQQYGELSLEARKAKNKIYLLQADFTAREDEIDATHDTALQDRDVRKAEAEQKATRRLLMTQGFGAYAGAKSPRPGSTSNFNFGRMVASIFGFRR
ncbi:MAG: hypothetical protein KME46_21940 [Brasilonema angustatum HA4187-MV1]|jgi:hypothetical protein|nr:hypothetical protein [Brasilonema angustatum HA4187-MV1]